MSEKEEKICCSGCSQEVSSGNIISFENAYWHPECFRCMKCNKIIDISDQNILLCEDKPICSECGYTCHVCGKAITGEAITADDMILHFGCFKCQRCGKYIDDLTYILVDNEIRCMNCTYNIDEDVQNDFGISSPGKNATNANETSEQGSLDDFLTPENGSPLILPSNIDDPDKKGKKLTAKHCSILHDNSHIQKVSVNDKKGLSSNDSTNFEPTLLSYAEEEEEEDESPIKEELDKNPSQRNYNNGDNKKFTNEEYFLLKVKNEELVTENDNLKDKNDQLSTKNEELVTENEKLKNKNDQLVSEIINLKDKNDQFLLDNEILKDRELELSSEVALLKEEQSSLVKRYEDKIKEEMKKNDSFEKTINGLLDEKKKLKESLTNANDKIKKHEENTKLDAIKYENENNLFQIKYEDLKDMYEKEKNERIVAESTIVRLQEEIHIRYLDELKYTYLYDIEAKYQSEFETLETQKQNSLSTLEYIGSELKKLDKEVKDYNSKGDSDASLSKSPNYDFQGKFQELINRYKNELGNIQNQKKLLQNEVNLLRNLRKGLINDNLIYMERFRKLKAEEASIQKKKQSHLSFRPTPKKNSLYKSSNDSLYFKYDLKKEDSNGGNIDPNSLASSLNEAKITDIDSNTVTLQKMEASVNNSFAVYETINKMINDSFQPPKIYDKHFSFSAGVTMNSDDSKDSLSLENSHNISLGELKSSIKDDDDAKSICCVPTGDAAFGQNKCSTVKKLKKTAANKKIYSSESVLYEDPKKSSMKENQSSDDLKVSSPLKLKIPENSHDFQYHKFLTPSKCEVCNDIIWGKEGKCKSCGMRCHIKCITDKIPECTNKVVDPEIAALYGFGTDLNKQATIEPDNVPFIVKKCTEEVEKRGMDFEGIYRKSGRTLLMKNLISIFSRGEDPDLSEEGEFSEITIITSVLKQYFRELPESVIPPDTYNKLTDLISNEENKELDIDEIRKCIESLDTSHYCTLRFIIRHLIKVSQFSDVNLMNIKNLSVVFGPTLIGSNEICPEVDFSSTGIKVKIINVILEHADTIFPQESDNNNN